MSAEDSRDFIHPETGEVFVPKRTPKGSGPAAQLIHATDFRSPNGCWEWIGCKYVNGYGQVRVGGRPRRVHRLAYELLVGPIPEGLTLDHLCRNRACLNPDHLEPVTRGENVLRGEGNSAINARKTHCANGHQYDAQNTYRYPSGKRACRTCNHERYLRQKVADG